MKITNISEFLLGAEAPRAEDLDLVSRSLQGFFPGVTVKIEGTNTLEKFISIANSDRKIFVLFTKKGMLEVRDFTNREVPAEVDQRYHFLAKRQADRVFENIEDLIGHIGKII